MTISSELFIGNLQRFHSHLHATDDKFFDPTVAKLRMANKDG